MLLGHRYYDQTAGRFLTKDPAKAGRNWYVYCSNRPTVGIDNSGLDGYVFISKDWGGAGHGNHVRMGYYGGPMQTIRFYGFYSDGLHVDDNAHADNGTLSISLDDKKFIALRKKLLQAEVDHLQGRDPNYHVRGFNCANWAAQILCPILSETGTAEADSISDPKDLYDWGKPYGKPGIPEEGWFGRHEGDPFPWTSPQPPGPGGSGSSSSSSSHSSGSSRISGS
jgi:hypothetical protein